MKCMKGMLAALCVLLLSGAASAEGGVCSHYAETGDHCWIDKGGEEETCTESGYRVYECSVCRTQETEYIPAYGHIMECIGEVEATCLSGGYGRYECSECGFQDLEYYPSAGHEWSDEYQLTAPSCVQEGFMLTSCDVCGEMGLRRIPKEEHAYSPWETVLQATDCSMGVYRRVCAVCAEAEEEAFYPEGTLYRDIKKSSEAVRMLQTMLTDCGYLDDQIDGEYGPRTEQAVRQFQESRYMTADGIAWPKVMNLLNEEWQARSSAMNPADTAPSYTNPIYTTPLYTTPGAQDVCLNHQVVTTGNVNLRTGPGLDYQIIKAVEANVPLGQMWEAAVDNRGVVWYKVIGDAGECWVSSRFSRALAGDVDYSMTRRPFDTALSPAEYYLLEGGTELANYYLCSMDIVNEALGLDGLVYAENGGWEASNWAVRIGGESYVEYLELYAGSWSVYGVRLYMHIDEATRLMENAGLYCAGGAGYERVFERPCNAGSVYINESGFDSYITMVLDRSGYIQKITWQPHR